MVTYKQFMKESGDSIYSVRKVDKPFSNDKHHLYHFKDYNGGNFETAIAHDDKNQHAEVMFRKQKSHRYFQSNMTKESGNDSHRVMSTIHNILKTHAEKHPDIKSYHFTSEIDEPGRVKLYKKYAEKFKGTNRPDFDDQENLIGYTHTIPTSGIKE